MKYRLIVLLNFMLLTFLSGNLSAEEFTVDIEELSYFFNKSQTFGKLNPKSYSKLRKDKEFKEYLSELKNFFMTSFIERELSTGSSFLKLVLLNDNGMNRDNLDTSLMRQLALEYVAHNFYKSHQVFFDNEDKDLASTYCKEAKKGLALYSHLVSGRNTTSNLGIEKHNTLLLAYYLFQGAKYVGLHIGDDISKFPCAQEISSVRYLFDLPMIVNPQKSYKTGFFIFMKEHYPYGQRWTALLPHYGRVEKKGFPSSEDVKYSWVKKWGENSKYALKDSSKVLKEWYQRMQ